MRPDFRGRGPVCRTAACYTRAFAGAAVRQRDLHFHHNTASDPLGRPPTGFQTADLDEHAGLQIAEPVFGDYGGEISFFGPITTLKAFEDNRWCARPSRKKARPGCWSSTAAARCAARWSATKAAALAEKNGWAGVIVNGCIRDSAAIADTEIGCKAPACTR